MMATGGRLTASAVSVHQEHEGRAAIPQRNRRPGD